MNIEEINDLENCDLVVTINSFSDDLIDSYGVLHLPVTGQAFKDVGLEKLDYIDMFFLGQKILCPIVPDYNYVDNGVTAVSFLTTKDEAMILTMGGQFAILFNLATRNGYTWTLKDNVKMPLKIGFKLHKKLGYQETFGVYSVLFATRSNVREEYPKLTDEEFCNFRAVKAGKIKEGMLFRSSSPINDKFKRDKFADRACEVHNIHKIVNLSDGETDIIKFKEKNDFDSTYYAKQDYLLLKLPADYTCDLFEEGIVKTMRFMIKNKYPTLIHCIEGKDRTGFFIALLEGLMGATTTEILEDYYKSYINFFMAADNPEYAGIIRGKILDMLSSSFRAQVTTKNMEELAYKYLLRIGLSSKEVDELKSYLSGN